MKRILPFILCLILTIPNVMPVYAVEGYNFDVKDSNFYKTGTWTMSSLKTQKGNQSLFANSYGCIAGWDIDIPDEMTTNVYYWIPEYTGNVNMSGIITVCANGVEKQLELTRFNESGWVNLGEYTFVPGGENFISLTSKHESYARIAGIKLEKKESADSYLVLPHHFNKLGVWSISSESAYNNECLMYKGKSDRTGNASITLDIPNGEYYLYIHSCDYPNYQPCTRNFSAILNKVEYKKDSSSYFGGSCNGVPAPDEEEKFAIWGWEKATYPAETVSVTDGKLILEIKHKASSARIDGIVLTKDPDFTPISMSYADMVCTKVDNMSGCCEKITFPSYGKEELLSTDIITLKNEHTTVNFRKGKTSENIDVVQRETYLGTTRVNNYTDGLGFMTLYASSAEPIPVAVPIAFRTQYKNNYNETISASTYNVFLSGQADWIIPNYIKKLSESSVEIGGENDYATLKSIWTLNENDKEPKVEVTFKVKMDGEFSFGFFNNVNEIPRNQIESVLLPYEYNEKRYPPNGEVSAESDLSAPISQATFKGNTYTLGVAVDKSSLKYKWARTVEGYFDRTDFLGNKFSIDFSEEQSDFAMGLTGFNGGTQPSLFAPILGSYDSNLTEGKEFIFTYRPTATLGDWYENYRHVATDILGIYDYRSNYFCSLTDTAFNIYNLLLDDYYSGWDENAKGHYNMEDSYWVTNSDGLSYLQFYLLTDDEDMLERRTIPSMAYILGRSGPHIWYRHSERDNPEGPLQRNPLGGINTMGNSTYAGAYLMTRGQTPIYHTIATQNLRTTYVRPGSGKKLTNPSEELWKARISDGKLQDTLNSGSDFMKYGVNVQQTNTDTGEEFSNRAIYPQYQPMLELYEETGDETYLNAAISSARRALPTFWIMSVPDMEAFDVYNGEEIHKFWLIGHSRYNMYWRGDNRGKIGVIEYRDPENPEKVYFGGIEDTAIVQSSEPIPQWVASRVGLGLEGKGTYSGYQQNIMLSTWAGELLRMGYLANDEYMMDTARNSIVGRYANYPGYYYRAYRTYFSEKDFPYRGPDTTNLYYHHIPIQLTLIQDYLFSNAYVMSDGKVDFPYTRTQGYAWFNNRHYGSDPGVIYDETEMWPWLKEGTITVSSKEIDWIGGRKDGRCAFVLTNASEQPQNITVNFNKELGIEDNSTVTVYDKSGNKSYIKVVNGKTELSVPQKGIITIALNAMNVTAPKISCVEFDKSDYLNKTMDLSTVLASSMVGDNVYSAEKGWDINAYTLQILPDTFYAYINAGFVSTAEDSQNGIDKLVVKYDNGNGIKTEEDLSFPFEFIIPTNSKNSIEFTVETHSNGIVKESRKMKLSSVPVEKNNDIEIVSYDETHATLNSPTEREITVVIAGYNSNRLEDIHYETFVLEADKLKTLNYSLKNSSNIKLFILDGKLSDLSPIMMRIIK